VQVVAENRTTDRLLWIMAEHRRVPPRAQVDRLPSVGSSVTSRGEGASLSWHAGLQALNRKTLSDRKACGGDWQWAIRSATNRGLSTTNKPMPELKKSPKDAVPIAAVRGNFC
jgi:hypothetical protein